MFNKTQLKQRGWTPALIRDLLDPPDRILTRRYPNPTPGPNLPAFLEGHEHLYLRVRVLELEQRPEFLRGAHPYTKARAGRASPEDAPPRRPPEE